MASKQVKEVAELALTDMKFFDALRKNPGKALADRGLKLTARELLSLKASLKGPASAKVVNLPKLIAEIHKNRSKYAFEVWDVDWSTKWIDIRPPKMPPGAAPARAAGAPGPRGSGGGGR
jgi:hypothetical protein